MTSELRLLSTLTRLIMSTKDLEARYNNSTDEARENIITRYREKVRSVLFLAQNKVSDMYSKKITQYIIFSTILSIDERCKLMLSQQPTPIAWHDFQIEFFQRSDGGEYFFEILDEMISNKIYPVICYEVLLIVLQNGFLGRYYQNPNHNERHKYIVDLKDIIKALKPYKVELTDKSIQNKPVKYNESNKNFLIVISLAISIPIILFLLTRYLEI
ncbi:DotU family type IV/VI secretion system protein [uncultured Shewanella sp.]|uniref:DotU family type IV/VI secretion system protein n=1 Tax=uncultured Shewanella sp. TaxID=173975 RepID=UPI0026220ABC|nr:DotU family type IV/VI secretion system protein [uncultured Shewanella sp.]